jgi:hypothetical protein
VSTQKNYNQYKSSNLALNDWEKIYDLPPHSSTITNKDPPPNIDVRRRLQLFESQAQQTMQQRRAYSERRNSESVSYYFITKKGIQKITMLFGLDFFI